MKKKVTLSIILLILFYGIFFSLWYKLNIERHTKLYDKDDGKLYVNYWEEIKYDTFIQRSLCYAFYPPHKIAIFFSDGENVAVENSHWGHKFREKQIQGVKVKYPGKEYIFYSHIGPPGTGWVIITVQDISSHDFIDELDYRIDINGNEIPLIQDDAQLK